VDVRLVEIEDEAGLRALLAVAVADATPEETMPPFEGPPGWTEEKQAYFLEFFRPMVASDETAVFAVTVGPRDGGSARPGERESAGPGERESAGPRDGESAGPGDGESAGPGDGGSARPGDGLGGGGEIAGFMRLKRMPDGGSAETGMWLARSYRGKGLAVAAFGALLAEAAKRGYHRIVADTTPQNVAALGVLRRGGARTREEGGKIYAEITIDPGYAIELDM
jgi:GNAT superfamily N-acetyltransferase